MTDIKGVGSTPFSEPPVSALVSVVLPNYNREATIRRSIDSVLRQTYTQFELIVVDDGSDDASISIVESYDDPRIRLVVLEQNSGASAARNSGIEAAVGEFVAFQDSDDEWLPEKLEHQVNHMAENPQLGAAFCALVRVNPVTRFVDMRPLMEPPVIWGDFQKTILRQNLMWTQTWIVRRKVFEAGFRFDPSLVVIHDWGLAIQISRKYEIAYLPKVLVVVSETQNSLMSSRVTYLEDLMRLDQKFGDLIYPYPAIYSKHCRRIAYFSSVYGRFSSTKSWLAKAVRREPRRIATWGQFLSALMGPRVYRFMIKLVS